MTVQSKRSAPRGRPRRPDVDRKILDTAATLLREQGPSAVTMEAVAARSGVAKTTVYRRYSGREELLRRVIDGIVGQGLPAEDLPPSEKLRWVLERAWDVLQSGLGTGGVAGVLVGDDPLFTDALRDALATHLSPLEQLISDEVAAGVLTPGVDADILINLVFGAHLGEVLRYGTPRQDWLDRTTDLLTLLLRGPLWGGAH